MATIYLFRHGETQESIHEGEYGSRELTAEILPQGKPAIRRIGEYLKNIPTDHNFSSEVLRCRETVEIISEISGKKFSFDSRLNEWLHDESFVHLKKRLTSFVNFIENSNFESIAACTHGACMAGIKHLIVDRDFTDSQYHDYPQTGYLWKFTQFGFEEMSFRD
jgi:broad specificity phosphatase PhoE